MKTGKARDITLSDAALAILKAARSLPQSQPDLIFPSSKAAALSGATSAKALKSEAQLYTVHRFRSSFRDCAAEKMAHIPDPVAEAALAH